MRALLAHRPALCVLLSAVSLHANAAHHALIWTIDYAGSKKQIHPSGIAADGKKAVEIALAMGIPDRNIQVLSNGGLELTGIVASINALTKTLQKGDKVFLYYSGHGTQYKNTSGSGGKCTEAIITHDFKYYEDKQLEAALKALTAKASQVVMLNDSCFSGGMASKSLDRGINDDLIAKFVETEKAGADNPKYECNRSVNKKMTRTIANVANQFENRLLYIAAASDTELAYAGRNGSVATEAWHYCMKARRSTPFITGEDLRLCAQDFVEKNSSRYQTITILGAPHLPLSFDDAAQTISRPKPPPIATQNGKLGSTSTPSAKPQTTPLYSSSSYKPQRPIVSTAPDTNDKLDPVEALTSLQQADNPQFSVKLTLANARLKINKDLLKFSVETHQEGYLYLLHVGTDGKFYQLYPNEKDKDNFLAAGKYTFPRNEWALQAQGPAGTSYFMAYLSKTERAFSREMAKDGAFAVTDTTLGAVRSLGVVAFPGTYGASKIAKIEEIN